MCRSEACHIPPVSRRGGRGGWPLSAVKPAGVPRLGRSRIQGGGWPASSAWSLFTASFRRGTTRSPSRCAGRSWKPRRRCSSGTERRGLLDLGDARLAAAQFAYLVLGIPQDRAQFCPQERPSPAERDRLAAEAVRVFLAAYR